MKEKVFNYDVESDVNQIECDVSNARIEISVVESGKYAISFPNAKNIFVGSGESGIFIRQNRKKLFASKKQTIKICVPAHVVPSLKLNARCADLTVNGGIYADLDMNIGAGKAELCGCSFGTVELSGGETDLLIKESTVKDRLYAKIEKGNIITENTFIPCSECRISRGNIGAVNINPRDCIFDVGKGNISAGINASEDEFNISVVAKEGTTNRDSLQVAGAERNFSAYTANGNIVLDFTVKKIEVIEPQPAQETIEQSEEKV